MDPSWSYGNVPPMASAADSGPYYLGPTAPGVAGLLLLSVGLIVLMKVAGFRAMIAVGRS